MVREKWRLQGEGPSCWGARPPGQWASAAPSVGLSPTEMEGRKEEGQDDLSWVTGKNCAENRRNSE